MTSPAPTDPADTPDRPHVVAATGASGADALHFRQAVIRESVPARASLPVRTCVGCRSRSTATGLLRVVAVQGVLTPDPRRRLPGRGAWLHPDPDCLSRALRRGAFPRALRVPAPLADEDVRRYVQSTTKCETVSHLDHESQVDPS